MNTYRYDPVSHELQESTQNLYPQAGTQQPKERERRGRSLCTCFPSLKGQAFHSQTSSGCIQTPDLPQASASRARAHRAWSSPPGIMLVLREGKEVASRIRWVTLDSARHSPWRLSKPGTTLLRCQWISHMHLFREPGSVSPNLSSWR